MDFYSIAKALCNKLADGSSDCLRTYNSLGGGGSLLFNIN